MRAAFIHYQDPIMTRFVTSLRRRFAQRSAYTRTLRALRDLPPHVADDLGIDPRDARTIALRTVYGKTMR
jgi:uncharacterized protein YjiS (DUF1127 family)